AAGEALYREGQRLFKEGKTHEACAKFAESQRADPATSTLMNLATCHDKEGKTASAWAEFNEAASRAATGGHPDIEKVARDQAAVLEKKLRTVVIDLRGGAPPAGLEVKLDNAPFGGGGSGTL